MVTLAFVLSGTDFHPEGAEEGPETAGRYDSGLDGGPQQQPSLPAGSCLLACLLASLNTDESILLLP